MEACVIYIFVLWFSYFLMFNLMLVIWILHCLNITGASEFTLVFSEVVFAQCFFFFLCNVLQIVVCPFVLFLFGHCVVCACSISDFWSTLVSSTSLTLTLTTSRWSFTVIKKNERRYLIQLHLPKAHFYWEFIHFNGYLLLFSFSIHSG